MDSFKKWYDETPDSAGKTKIVDKIKLDADYILQDNTTIMSFITSSSWLPDFRLYSTLNCHRIQSGQERC